MDPAPAPREGARREEGEGGEGAEESHAPRAEWRRRRAHARGTPAPALGTLGGDVDQHGMHVF